jgi:murein DD-endopeptidase MepM/ murein hydrolase activator NlpD
MTERLRRAFNKGFKPALAMGSLALVAAAIAAHADAALHRSYATKFDVEAPSQPIMEGAIFTISIQSTDEIRDATGTFQDHLIEFFPNSEPGSAVRRYTALVGVEYGTPAGKLEMKIRARIGEGWLEKTAKVEVKAGQFPSEILKVPPRTVTPTRRDQRQIAKDTALLARIYAAKTNQRFWDPPGILPVESDVTSVFGTSRLYNGKKTNAHLGTDLRAPTGTPIIAPYTGVVAVARNLFYTGNTVILDHGYGLFTIYGHMSKLKVKEGHIAKKGEILGLSGATGRVSGPHLHWGVNLHGTKVDPLVLVQALK